MPDPRTQIVADGYDAMGETFAAWREQIVGDPRDEWEQEFTSRLADGARLLELGCGGGTVETRRLASRFRLTGVDISPKQVERARAAIPEAEFVCADFTDLELPAGSFDAVCSFYVFNHVPRELLAPLLGSIHGWLVSGRLAPGRVRHVRSAGLDGRVARSRDVLLGLPAGGQLATRPRSGVRDRAGRSRRVRGA